MNDTSVKLYTAQNCPHCAYMKSELTRLAEQGMIEKIQVLDVAKEPLPQSLQFIRSVPVTIIHGLPFTGKYTAQEISPWLNKKNSAAFYRDYLADHLNNGQLSLVISLLRNMPELFHYLIPLLADMETPMQVRIGITALFEELEASPLLLPLVPDLLELAQRPEHNIKTDAIYYLSLVHTAELSDYFQSLRNDASEEIRELAEDALTRLKD